MTRLLSGTLALLLFSSPALAQQPSPPAAPLNVREAVKHMTFAPRRAVIFDAVPSAVAQRHRRPAGAAAAAAAAGAFGGLFLGGYIGAKIDRTYWDCNCDDPGL